MGAGASLDPHIITAGGGSTERYFCHSCHRVFGIGSVDNPHDLSCPYCESTFLEELVNSSARAIPTSSEETNRNYGQLTLDQTRRMTSATAMLRLLESQLREELNQLQQIFETQANQRIDPNSGKAKKFSKIMQSRCRNVKLNIDLICSQPSCPVCSEDFILGEHTYRLPCSHVFHETCVLPWLQMKQNCPICRADLPDQIPTKDELNKMSTEELMEKLNSFDDIKEDPKIIEDKPTEELIDTLLSQYEKSKAEEDESDRQQQLEADRQRQGTMALIAGPRMFRIDMRPTNGTLLSTASSSSTSPSLFTAGNLALGGGNSNSFSTGGRLILTNHSRSHDENLDEEDDEDDNLYYTPSTAMINNTRASNGYYSRNQGITRSNVGSSSTSSPQYRSFMQLTSENGLHRGLSHEDTSSITNDSESTRPRDDRMMMMWRTLLNEDPFASSSRPSASSGLTVRSSFTSGTDSLIPRSGSSSTFSAAGAASLSNASSSMSTPNTFQILSTVNENGTRSNSNARVSTTYSLRTLSTNPSNTTNTSSMSEQQQP